LSLNLDQFTAWNATFEVRYDTAFLFWDRSGSIWAEVKKRYPEATVEQASPNQVRISVDDRTSAAASVDKAHFTVVNPKNDLRELQSFSKVLFPPLLRYLDVSSLTRVGLRVVYGKRFDGRKEAADFVSAHSPIPKLKGKHLNVDGIVFEPEMYFQYEGDVLGFSIRIKAHQTKMTLAVPVEFQDALKENRAERSYVTLDVDYYAHGITPITSFDASAIIEGWLHVIRRDIGKVL
jgi:hypothetical protein